MIPRIILPMFFCCSFSPLVTLLAASAIPAALSLAACAASLAVSVTAAAPVFSLNTFAPPSWLRRALNSAIRPPSSAAESRVVSSSAASRPSFSNLCLRCSSVSSSGGSAALAMGDEQRSGAFGVIGANRRAVQRGRIAMTAKARICVCVIARNELHSKLEAPERNRNLL